MRCDVRKSPRKRNGQTLYVVVCCGEFPVELVLGVDSQFEPYPPVGSSRSFEDLPPKCISEYLRVVFLDVACALAT